MRKQAVKISVSIISIIYAVICPATGAQEIRLPVCLPEPGMFFKPDTIDLCFVGDMMMHSRQMEFETEGYFTRTEHIFRSADITAANMEFTLAGEPYTGYPAFSAPDDYARLIAESGVNIFLCANNHILDKGSTGALRTLEQYRILAGTHGIRFTGMAGSQEELDDTTPLIVECKGRRIAFINFTYGTNLGYTSIWPKVNYMNQRELLSSALHKADSLADFTIVLPHWGEEYSLMHSESQEQTARWLIERGADMIIGTHPHVVQDIDDIDGVTVAYSLGNAVSNMSAPNTQLGLMLKVRLTTGMKGKIHMASVEPIYTWCSRPGGYETSYTVLPVEEYMERQAEWIGKWDYDKMMQTYSRIINIHDK